MADVKFQEFQNKQQQIDDITLDGWVHSFRSQEELRTVFLYMDRALKYVHTHGYCVKSFHPKEIELLHSAVNQIKFDTLLEMPGDVSSQKQLIQEDIYHSAFLQIGLYSNYFWEPNFLKENFDSISMFLPKEDVSYYKGVIQRGASVYFNEYVSEKQFRDLQQLEKQMGNDASGGGLGRQFIKSNGKSVIGEENDSVNDQIYRQINGKDDAAFISFLLYPTLLLVIATIGVFIAWLVSVGIF